MIRMNVNQFFGMIVTIAIVCLFGSLFYIMYAKHSENMEEYKIRQMIVKDSLEHLKN